ncbi:hypothetical protein roselon_03252 [Roseibacterium elongatum DSM 19469]|uniref:Uncharacterized protein n=1 Tax=Roseicyclus elongatus DSM 19469 TaxID=1294273 RepID=W8SSM5_9RHOB|nr:hypothetical protein roselon_03252 [Roseibacterium elongatum DSM 19469]
MWKERLCVLLGFTSLSNCQGFEGSDADNLTLDTKCFGK